MITIFTCVTNAYVDLNCDQPNNPNFKYICFTDGSIEVKEPWIEINLNETRHWDYIKNLSKKAQSEYPKLRPDCYFDEGDILIWTDGHNSLLESAIINTVENLKTKDILFKLHPEVVTYCDEMLFLYCNGLIKEKELISTTEKLVEQKYDFEKFVAIISAYVGYKLNENTINFGKKWWDEFTNFECATERDQIPLGLVLENPKCDVVVYERGFPTRDETKTNFTKHNAMKLRPSLSDLARVQSYITNATKSPLLAHLDFAKPLQV